MSIETYCEKLEPFINILKIGVIPIFNIGVPLILIVLGVIDFAKATASGDDKVVKEAQSSFVKRLILGVVIFFVPLLISLVFTLVGDALEEDVDDPINATSWMICWSGKVTSSSEDESEGSYTDDSQEPEGEIDYSDDNYNPYTEDEPE